jgi:putative membrane protein
MGFLARWLVTFLAVLVVGELGKSQGLIVYESIEAVAVFALVLGLLNAFVRPVLAILTLPLSIITLGLFSLVLNLIMFWLADALVPGLEIPGGILWMIVVSLAISVVASLIGRVAGVR